MVLLSILIPTIVEREESFLKLKTFLEEQIVKAGLESIIEILYLSDNRQYPIGTKRNVLINAAKGNYIVFIDDDDWVSEDYVISIYEALTSSEDIDCVGIQGLLLFQGKQERIFKHSIKYTKYSDDSRFYYRPPNHISPIKRDIAIKYSFADVNIGEDTDWAMRLCKDQVLKKEVMIDTKILYYYFFDPNKSATQGKK